jgi:hypothetical protein
MGITVENSCCLLALVDSSPELEGQAMSILIGSSALQLAEPPLENKASLSRQARKPARAGLFEPHDQRPA